MDGATPLVVEMNRLNILVFLTDDHGSWANGCYGNPDVHSPSIDYLARSGVRFLNAFTPCPVCSPARASFWTGKIPSAHGVHDHIGNREHPGITGQTNLAETLRGAGYHTGLCGKWHAHATGAEPQSGFDSWFSQWGGTAARFGPQPFSRNGTREDHHGDQAPIVADAALRFLSEWDEAQTDRPFFLFVGFTDTHSPFEALPERLAAKYRDAPLTGVQRDTFPASHGVAFVPAPEEEEAWREQLAQYYASVELVDEQVGRILDRLEGSGRLEDTLIVYASDHGHMNGQHGLCCKGNATTPQNFLEESIRVPLVVRPPRAASPGRELAIPVDHCDLHATLRDAAGLGAAPDLPGRSWLSFLDSAEVPPDSTWRKNQFCEYGNARMIRTDGGFKYIRRYPGPNGHFRDEFYDLQVDPGERSNLIDDVEYGTRIEELGAELERFFARYEDKNCAGTNVSALMPCNPDEPWRRGRTGDVQHVDVTPSNTR